MADFTGCLLTFALWFISVQLQHYIAPIGAPFKPSLIAFSATSVSISSFFFRLNNVLACAIDKFTRLQVFLRDIRQGQQS
jgi:hypothetical protein